jgi:hypothetical protein
VAGEDQLLYRLVRRTGKTYTLSPLSRSIIMEIAKK